MYKSACERTLPSPLPRVKLLFSIFFKFPSLLATLLWPTSLSCRHPGERRRSGELPSGRAHLLCSHPLYRTTTFAACVPSTPATLRPRRVRCRVQQARPYLPHSAPYCSLPAQNSGSVHGTSAPAAASE